MGFPLRVLVEPAIFRYGRCGLTRYYAALCEGLAATGIELDIPLLASNCDYQPGLTRFAIPLRHIPKAIGLLNALTTRLFRSRLRRGRFDCVLVTSASFDPAFLAVRPDVPFVMVVHDLMTCVTAPDGLYDSAGPSLTHLLYLAARATRVICISEDTRRSLLNAGDFDADKVVTIHTGNLLAASNPREIPMPLPPRFVLFVGERSGRKNFFAVARALKDLLAQHPDLHLICTGNLIAAERDYLARLGVAHRVQAIPTPDGLLVHLYRNALCLVYPSLYEGFGLPVLEAMHYGCPVISTTRGALAEVCGNAALIVNPDHPHEIRAAIESLLHDRQLRADLIQQGHAQAAKFQVDTMMQRFQEEFLALGRP